MRKIIAFCPICGAKEDVTDVPMLNVRNGKCDVGCGECGEPKLCVRSGR